jgi:uncharacterized repeat protein (TIGR01451 family)
MRERLSLVSAVTGLLIGSLLVLEARSRATVGLHTSATVVINEVAWGGTAANSSHEWIELYNNTATEIDLTGWTLASSDGSPNISLSGTILGHDYYLLERVSDCAVSDIPADQPPYSGVLGNSGERLELRDRSGTLIDQADGSGGWPAGSGAPGYHSMERVDAAAPDAPANWASNDGLTRNGLDCNADPLNGTPRGRNSATPLPAADLQVRKGGPSVARPGERITYTLVVSNVGNLAAESARLTDRLPAEVDLVSHTAPYPLQQPQPGMLVWDLGTVPGLVRAGAQSALGSTPGSPIAFVLVGHVVDGVRGELTNLVSVTSATEERNAADNYDAVTTVMDSGPTVPNVLIEAVYYDSYESGQVDEALRLMNVSHTPVNIGYWRVTDLEETAVFPPDTWLGPGQAVWCTRQAVPFTRQFGFRPDFETGDTDPLVPEMAGSFPRLADGGDECLLRDEEGQIADVVVYREGDTSIEGWQGAAVWPWTPSITFPARGQILYRKRDQLSGKPITNTPYRVLGSAADWAQDPSDQTDGRRVLYPGWDLDRFFSTARVTETAAITLAVGPDHLYESVASLLAGAQEQIQIASYTFRSLELAEVLIDRLQAGVSVTLLLEGAPAFEGVSVQQKGIVSRLHNLGAQILYMISDSEARIFDRYRSQHAKYIVIDSRLVLIGSENMSDQSMPADDKADGTAGRRGVYVVTDAPGVVSRVQAVFEADADPANHADVAGCDRVADLCTPPAGFEPAPTPNWMSYTVQFPSPGAWQGIFAFELIQSPENSLRTADSLLGLLSRAGPGDTIYAEQLYERSHWASSAGSPEGDPNLRLQAYLQAARSGARVRLLLDDYLDSEGANKETLTYLRAVAFAESLDLQVRLANPTHLGLHNKMILAQIGGRGFVHVGSLNGSEASFKVNRELALQIQSDAAYAYLAEVFDYDWRTATPPVYMPIIVKQHRSLLPADHLLISEVYYASAPEKEWVEIYNPSGQAIDLTNFKIGDAAQPQDYEGMGRFPPGTVLAPRQTLVLAVTASGFQQNFPGRLPDLEIFDTSPAVPDLLGYADWGLGEWGLHNDGDQVLVLDSNDRVVDVVVYGLAVYPGVVPHPGGIAYNHSLERYPAWLDTDDCSADFRDWPFPNPGQVP